MPHSTGSVDEHDVHRFLLTRFGSDLGDVITIGAGQWSRAYSFELGGEQLIFRLGNYDEDFAKDRIAVSFQQPGLPIPRFIEMGKALGAFYAITERAYGHFLDKLSREDMAAALPSLFATLDAMRQVKVAENAGFGGWDRKGVGPQHSWQEALLDITTENSRLDGWKQRIHNWPGCASTLEQSIEALHELVDLVPNQQHVIHGDLLNRNVLVADGAVSSVFDWVCSRYGDFLYDIAWLTFWAPDVPGLAGQDVRGLAKSHLAAQGADLTNFDDRLRCYEVHIGVDHQIYKAFLDDHQATTEMGKRTLEAAE